MRCNSIADTQGYVTSALTHQYTDGLVQKWHNPSVSTIELHLIILMQHIA